MKTDTAHVQTAVLPRQSSATKKNVHKLKIYLSKNGKGRQNTK